MSRTKSLDSSTLHSAKITEWNITTDEFVRGYQCALRLKHGEKISCKWENPVLENGFGETIAHLEHTARVAYDFKTPHKRTKTREKNFAFRLWEVLNNLRPSPNTGSFDGFWGAFRAGWVYWNDHGFGVTFTLNVSGDSAKNYLKKFSRRMRIIIEECAAKTAKSLA